MITANLRIVSQSCPPLPKVVLTFAFRQGSQDATLPLRRCSAADMLSSMCHENVQQCKKRERTRDGSRCRPGWGGSTRTSIPCLELERDTGHRSFRESFRWRDLSDFDFQTSQEKSVLIITRLFPPPRKYIDALHGYFNDAAERELEDKGMHSLLEVAERKLAQLLLTARYCPLFSSVNLFPQLRAVCAPHDTH